MNVTGERKKTSWIMQKNGKSKDTGDVLYPEEKPYSMIMK